MRYFASVLFLFLFTLPVFGQVTFKKEFDRRGEKYTIYNKFVSVQTDAVGVISGLETWRINEDNECQFIVSAIDHHSNRIEFPRGVVWEAEKKKNGMLFTFPNGDEVLYKYTEEDPREICVGGERI